jgi:hypothetical protein
MTTVIPIMLVSVWRYLYIVLTCIEMPPNGATMEYSVHAQNMRQMNTHCTIFSIRSDGRL